MDSSFKNKCDLKKNKINYLVQIIDDGNLLSFFCLDVAQGHMKWAPNQIIDNGRTPDPARACDLKDMPAPENVISL